MTIKSSIYCCSALSLASISLILKLPSLINESSIRFESPLSLSPYLLCKSKLSSSEVAINGSGVEERFLPLSGRFDDFVLCLKRRFSLLSITLGRIKIKRLELNLAEQYDPYFLGKYAKLYLLVNFERQNFSVTVTNPTKKRLFWGSLSSIFLRNL